MHPRATSWPSPPQGGARRYVLTTCVTSAAWRRALASFLRKAEALQRASEPGSYLSIVCPTGETTHWILRSLMLPYSTAITDSQYFARHCVPSKYVRWCDSSSLCTHKANTLMPGRWCRRRRRRIAGFRKGRADSVVIRFHSCILVQYKE